MSAVATAIIPCIFFILGVFLISVKPLTTEITENKTTPKFCKITVVFSFNGACVHYVMVLVSKFQWKPFWLATQRDPQNDWTATQNRVNHDMFAQAPFPLQTGGLFRTIGPLEQYSVDTEVSALYSVLVTE